MAKKENKVSLLEYAQKHNPQLTRRNKPMTFSYLYRLIREDKAGKNKAGNDPRPLWFKYIMEGDKDRIWVILD